MRKNNRKKGKIKFKGFIILIILLSFAAGSTMGALAEVKIDGDSKAGAFKYVEELIDSSTQKSDRSAVFKESVKNNAVLLGIMFFAGLTVVLFPAVILVILYKGAAIGFTSALIMESSGDAGIIKCCTALLPHNLLFIPLFAIYGYVIIYFVLNVIQCKNKRFRKQIYIDGVKLYFLSTTACLVLLCCGAGVEALINPVLTGIIAK